MNSKFARLYDVFISGPLYIYFSTFIQNKYLRLFVFLVGLMNIIYNGHNWLLLENKSIKKSLLPFVTEEGKTQTHRLYNLIIMYPLIYYANSITESPLKRIINFMIALGVIINLINFIELL